MRSAEQVARAVQRVRLALEGAVVASVELDFDGPLDVQVVVMVGGLEAWRGTVADVLGASDHYRRLVERFLA